MNYKFIVFTQAKLTHVRRNRKMFQQIFRYFTKFIITLMTNKETVHGTGHVLFTCKNVR